MLARRSPPSEAEKSLWSELAGDASPVVAGHDRPPAARPLPPPEPQHLERWSPADRFAPLPTPTEPAPEPPRLLTPPAWTVPEPSASLWHTPVAGPRHGEHAAPNLWTAIPAEAEPAGRRRLAPWLLALGAVAAASIVAALLALPRASASRPAALAVFNAPMLVLRASSAGRVADIGVTAGQAVDPGTRLLSIHTDPPADPALATLRGRVDAARSRLAALDATTVQPAALTDPARARAADQRQQRAAAGNDLLAAQDALARHAPPEGADWPVLAGVHGIVRSIETQPDAAIAAGLPLIRLLDCDHAFLTIPDKTDLQAGEMVGVRLPPMPGTVGATVRAASGVAEPANSLVIPLGQAALGGACPVGATATVVPASELGRDRRS